jgi:hypothetical protein
MFVLALKGGISRWYSQTLDHTHRHRQSGLQRAARLRSKALVGRVQPDHRGGGAP